MDISHNASLCLLICIIIFHTHWCTKRTHTDVVKYFYIFLDTAKNTKINIIYVLCHWLRKTYQHFLLKWTRVFYFNYPWPSCITRYICQSTLIGTDLDGRVIKSRRVALKSLKKVDSSQKTRESDCTLRW